MCYILVRVLHIVKPLRGDLNVRIKCLHKMSAINKNVFDKFDLQDVTADVLHGSNECELSLHESSDFNSQVMVYFNQSTIR